MRAQEWRSCWGVVSMLKARLEEGCREVLSRAGRVLASAPAGRLQHGEAGGDGQTSQGIGFSLILCLYICPHALRICLTSRPHRIVTSPPHCGNHTFHLILCGLSTMHPQQQLVQCHVFKVTHLLLERWLSFTQRTCEHE